MTITQENEKAQAELAAATKERDEARAEIAKINAANGEDAKKASERIAALEADKAKSDEAAKVAGDKLVETEKALSAEKDAHAALLARVKLNPAFMDIAGTPAEKVKVGKPGANDEAGADAAAIMAQYNALKDSKPEEAHEFWKKNIEGKDFSGLMAKRQ